MRISDWSSDVCSSDLPDFVGILQQQAVGLQCRQALSRAGEILVEDQPVMRTEDTLVHHAMTHQLVDQLAPDQVILIQLQATHQRQAAGVQRRVIADQVTRILAVAVANAADGTDTSSEEPTSEIQ